MISRKDIAFALEPVLSVPDLKSCVRFIGPFKGKMPTRKIKVTRRHPHKRREKHSEFLLTIGGLSYSEKNYARRQLRDGVKPVVLLR